MLQEWSFPSAHPNVDHDHHVDTTAATTTPRMFLMADICKSNGACGRPSWSGRAVIG